MLKNCTQQAAYLRGSIPDDIMSSADKIY